MDTSQCSEVLVIDRSVPFNPAKFIREGWTIWKGPRDGNGLDGEEQQDIRSLEITELKFEEVYLKYCVKRKNWRITEHVEGEQAASRLDRDYFQFIYSCFINSDAKIAQALFEEPDKRTLEWIRVSFKKKSFDFPGTELRGPAGSRHVLCLYWMTHTGWQRGYSDCLDSGFRLRNSSLLVATDRFSNF